MSVDFDADWAFVEVKQTVSIFAYSNDTYGPEILDVDAYTYDLTRTENTVEQEERGWVLRACKIPDHQTAIVQGTKIVQDDGTIWIVYGDIKYLTNNTRIVVSAYKSKA